MNAHAFLRCGVVDKKASHSSPTSAFKAAAAAADEIRIPRNLVYLSPLTGYALLRRGRPVWPRRLQDATNRIQKLDMVRRLLEEGRRACLQHALSCVLRIASCQYDDRNM